MVVNDAKQPGEKGQFIDCIMPATDQGAITLSFDLVALKKHCEKHGPGYVEESSAFVVGTSFLADFYTIFDLSSGTVSFYSIRQENICTGDAQYERRRFLSSSKAPTVSPSVHPSQKPTQRSV